jgi:hypothetical protein
MDWARTLAYVTGVVDQELLARIEYLAAENRSAARNNRIVGDQFLDQDCAFKAYLDSILLGNPP